MYAREEDLVRELFLNVICKTNLPVIFLTDACILYPTLDNNRAKALMLL